jgi:8-amino-3,8-dideoxy-alpha-D-manno-octulosonate transaminase
VAQAEDAFAKAIGVKHVLAVNSCTSALVAAFKACDIGAGDEVIVPGYTFFATAATVAAANAVPVIADVDDSLTLDPDGLERLLTRRTKAVAVVHMRGTPAQMDRITDFTTRKGLALIEDVAQACGGSFGGRRLGTWGAMGCFSLDYYKLITSGEGGFVVTGDEYLFMRAQSWHDTAACWRPNRYARERREGELFCGENYRMSELQGTVALAQIPKMDVRLAGYRRAKKRIMQGIGRPRGVAFQRLPDPDGECAVNVLFFARDTAARERILAALKAEGVPASGIYSETVRDWHIYRHWDHVLECKAATHDGLPWSALPAAERPRYSTDMCPRALDLLGRLVAVNVCHDYTDEECDAIAAGVRKVLQALGK